MKKICAFLLLVASSVTHSASFTANFTGKLTHGACALNEESEEQAIDFGTIISKGLMTNDSSPKLPLLIKLENCDITTLKYATVTFSGLADIDQPEYLSVTGAAKGIAIGIETTNGVLIPINTTSSTMDLQEGTTVLAFDTYVKASQAAIAENGIVLGEFSAIASFVIGYE